MDVTIVQELSVLLKDVVTLVITTVITIIGFYIRSYLQSNKFVAIAEKYKLDNERIERVLANALAYAESTSKKLSVDAINDREAKYNLAKNYITEVAPDIMDKENKNIDMMLGRKEEQLKYIKDV